MKVQNDIGMRTERLQRYVANLKKEVDQAAKSEGADDALAYLVAAHDALRLATCEASAIMALGMHDDK